jgi:hypothetical protein
MLLSMSSVVILPTEFSYPVLLMMVGVFILPIFTKEDYYLDG